MDLGFIEFVGEMIHIENAYCNKIVVLDYDYQEIGEDLDKLDYPVKLYVGNLPYSADDDALISVFGPFGGLNSAVVITDKYSGGRSKGFGFVEYKMFSTGQRVIESLNETELNGRMLRVTIARARPDAGSAPSGENWDAPRGENWVLGPFGNVIDTD